MAVFYKLAQNTITNSKMAGGNGNLPQSLRRRGAQSGGAWAPGDIGLDGLDRGV